MTNLDNELGVNVNSHMFRRRMTQTQLGRLLGMTQTSLSKKMHGERKWTLQEVYDVAAALGVDVAELLPRRDSNLQPSDCTLRSAA